MAPYMEIICGFAVVFLALYYYFTSTFDFWKVRGVPGPRPIPVFGNMKDMLLRKTALCDYIRDLYNEYKDEPMIGIFARGTPVIVLRDPELIKDVLIRDFSKFVDRGFPVVEKAEPLSPHLFNLEAERWRPIRGILSPVFTSGKLKEMYPLIMECGKHLEQYLDRLVSKGDPVACRELTGKFALNVIGSCALGLEFDIFTDGNHEIVRMSKLLLKAGWRFRLKEIAPTFYNLLGHMFPETEITSFFTKIIVSTLEYRRKNNVARPDFIQLLLNYQNNSDKTDTFELTDTLLTAQAFVFLIAALETSSGALTNTLYELALNVDVQKKLRQEIKEYFAESNGELKYDDIKDLKYLNLVFRETLRKYPSGPVLIRKSLADYTFKSTNVSIPAKSFVWIPFFAIHRDPAIYPNPDAFIPERFTDDAIAARHPMHYLPFGDGPRNCIGARFAVLQVKVGLISILRRYRMEVCNKTTIPIVFDPASILTTPKEEIYLKFIKDEN